MGRKEAEIHPSEVQKQKEVQVRLGCLRYSQFFHFRLVHDQFSDFITSIYINNLIATQK